MGSWQSIVGAFRSNGWSAFWRRYQLGIYARYAREGDGWQSHIVHSKERILDFVSRHTLRSLTILGSGWLLDVPLRELAERCNKIVLVDRFHPRQAQSTAQQFDNVELIQCDVTGGLALLKPRKKNWDAYALAVNALAPPMLPPTDAVVSLNLLSQLAMPIQERYDGAIPPNIYSAAAASLEASHLALLARYPRWLLITDTEERHALLANGTPLPSVKTVETPLPPLQNPCSWEWQFDTKGYYEAGHRVTLHVESGECVAGDH